MESTTTTATASQRVAANVRAELARRRMTWADFGVRMGWSKSTTSRRRNAETNWEVDEVELAEQVLGLAPNTLSLGRTA